MQNKFKNLILKLQSYLLQRQYRYDLEEGYKLYEDRNHALLEGKKTKQYSKLEIEKMLLAIEDINSRMKSWSK